MMGCSTIDMPKGTRAGYSSARFMKVKEYPAGVSSNKALNQKVQRAIAAEMEKAGISITAAKADLIVAYMLLKQDNVSTTSIDNYYGYGDDSKEISRKVHKKIEKGGQRESFDRGAIVIDLIDARKNKLVYRSYAVRDVLEDVSAQTRNKRIQEAVQEALADFFK